MEDRLAPVAESLVHKNGDRIDFKALRAPAEGAIGWRVATTNNIHPKRLLRWWPEKADLDVEVVLL